MDKSYIIQRIIKYAYLINNTATDKAITGDKPTIFVDFIGHLCQLDVRIYINGWYSIDTSTKDFEDEYDKNVEQYSAYLTKEEDNVILGKALNRLKEIYKEWSKDGN